MGRIEDVLAAIRQGLSHYLAEIYEQAAAEVLKNHMDRFFPFSAVGRWWDRNEEIDLVAVNSALDSILFAEVKWTEKPVGIDIYESLHRKSGQVVWGTEHRRESFCLFSKSGFTKAMMNRAAEDGVVLFKEDTIVQAVS